MGRLGDGHGKWHLSVTSSDGPLLVVNLMATPSGHLTNLSYSPGLNSRIRNPELWGAHALYVQDKHPPPSSSCSFAWGLTHNRPSEQDALNRANAACESGGGHSCSLQHFRGCAAVVKATRPDEPTGLVDVGLECVLFAGQGNSRDAAEADAEGQCILRGYADCGVAVSPSGERASTCNANHYF